MRPKRIKFGLVVSLSEELQPKNSYDTWSLSHMVWCEKLLTFYLYFQKIYKHQTWRGGDL